MSIKIEGVGGSRENVFSDSDSGMPLWNGAPLLNLVYPVGSIYWSSNNTNPGTLFGGTWTQIKDRFILAAGDYYSNGATGGAASVTLTVSNMPSHSHSFTPSGTVSSHHHTGPSHTHDLKNGTANVATQTSTSITHYIRSYDDFRGGVKSGGHLDESVDSEKEKITITASSTSSSIISGNTEAAGTGNTGDTAPSFSGTAGNTGATTPSFTGTAGNTGATTPSFTGTAGNTSSSGSGSSFSILPPYIVKYCWERTA